VLKMGLLGGSDRRAVVILEPSNRSPELSVGATSSAVSIQRCHNACGPPPNYGSSLNACSHLPALGSLNACSHSPQTRLSKGNVGPSMQSVANRQHTDTKSHIHNYALHQMRDKSDCTAPSFTCSSATTHTNTHGYAHTVPASTPTPRAVSCLWNTLTSRRNGKTGTRMRARCSAWTLKATANRSTPQLCLRRLQQDVRETHCFAQTWTHPQWSEAICVWRV
jgi:hypothetical protein